MLVTEMTEPAVLRHRQIQPGSKSPGSTQGPYLRRLISYVGGDPAGGWINDNPETGLISERTVSGILWLHAGHRQYGVHNHTVAEIFVILQGTVEAMEPAGRRQIAGPLDCLYMEPGVPHSVRAIGTEDVILLWVHDALEQATEGVSEYWDDEDEAPDRGAARTRLVRWADLEPDWSLPRAGEGGYLRRTMSWVGGAEGKLHFNRDTGIVNDRLVLGATVIEPGNREPAHSHATAEHMLIVSGRAAPPDDGEPLGPLDFVLAPPGVEHGLRALGDERLAVVWIREEVEPDGRG
ncbi:MAG TPA: cupin domain-containing protein [Solirubrobacterales bacterium]|nr:cupin domain-containing protein [Solirubrobacterales bacterium]